MVLPMGVSWLEQQRSPTHEVSIAITQEPEPQPEVLEGTPRHISIPSLGIGTNVLDGAYDPASMQWLITEESAFYAPMTSPASTRSGNTFIYGHNSRKIFGQLPSIQPGATATVTTDNGIIFEYEFSGTETVAPTDVHVLDYTDSPRLTLQTCTGLFNETRTMVYFNLVHTRKP